MCIRVEGRPGKVAPLPAALDGILLAALVGLLWSCVGPANHLQPPGEGGPSVSLYVVNHGWHTGIILRRRDIPEGVWPEHNDFAGSDYLEVGWGDAEFYRAADPTWGLALRAAFSSTSSVLYVVGFQDLVGRFPAVHEIVEVKVSTRSFGEVGAFIGTAYARDEAGEVISLGPGPAPNSRFYLARGRYSLLNTCNNWVARALRSAGCAITPLYAVTARIVMYQVKQCAAAIGSR